VPLAHTILYHRRPSLLVTARHRARNAATTNLSALVVEAYTSSSSSSRRSQLHRRGSVTTSRELYVAGPENGAAPLRLQLTLTEHPATSATAQVVCGGGSGGTALPSADRRLLSVHVQTLDGDPSRLREIHRERVAGRRRSWLVRLHLRRGESLDRAATANIGGPTTVPTQHASSAIEVVARAQDDSEAPAVYATPFGGEGQPPPPRSGPVVEVELGMARAGLMRVQVCTFAHVPEF
jgi:hypothetical protein